MRPDVERTIVAALEGFEDMNASRIARMTGIPRSTIRGWLHPKPGRRRMRKEIAASDLIAALPAPEYSYLLGFYLGDGTLSLYRKGVSGS
jgi:hypothetical protein